MNKQNKNLIKKNKKPKSRNRNDKAILLEAYGPLISSRSYQPRWMRTPMKYCEQFTTTVAATSVVDQLFQANSVFDPDSTGVGHQPRGFDQLTPQYNRYRVNGLRWHVEMAGASLSYNAVVALVNGTQTYTSIIDAGETNLKSPIKSSTASGLTIKFSGKSDMWVINGKSELSYHVGPDTGALTTADPVETINLHVVIQNVNGSSIAVNYVVTLIYDVIFYDQIIPARS